MHIVSSILAADIDYMFSLPETYTNSDRYPLLIVLDGDDFYHQVAGTIRYYSRIGIIPPLIVLGIDAGHRWRDYTPTRANIPDGTKIPQSGGADNFLSFLAKELIPTIDSLYATAPLRLLAGHSLAGLLVCHSFVSRPNLFRFAIATSPSLWWDGEVITRRLAIAPVADKAHKRIYITIGNEGPTMHAPVSRFHMQLKTIDQPTLQVKFRHLKETEHQTMFPQTFARGIEFLLKDWPMPAGLIEIGIDSVEAHYRRISSAYGYAVEIPETVINRLGYTALRNGDTERAVTLFRRNVENHPFSANAHDSLGEAYAAAGEPDSARVHYQRSLTLNPENSSAAEMLRNLEK